MMGDASLLAFVDHILRTLLVDNDAARVALVKGTIGTLPSAALVES